MFFMTHILRRLSKTLRMCLSGNPIIRGNENDNGFHKTVFVFIPKSTTYLILVPPLNTLSFELSPSSPPSTTRWPPLRPHSLVLALTLLIQKFCRTLQHLIQL